MLRYSVRDLITMALYPMPNLQIAETVAQLHGHSRVVIGWPSVYDPMSKLKEFEND